MSPRDIVVIGIGNDFRRDDGAGPAIVAGLAAMPPAVRGHARLAVCDGEPTRLIDLWDDADTAIVVDAVQAGPGAGTAPGSLLCWEVDPRTGDLVAAGRGAGAKPIEGGAAAIPPAPGPSTTGLPAATSAGTHTLGPGAAIGLARALDRLPSRLLVLAVVGADFAQGPGLSEQVAAAVPAAVDLIAAELR